MFSTPFCTFDDKFVAFVAKAINRPTWQVDVVVVVAPHSLRLGFSLSEFAGVVGFSVVSGEETRLVKGVQLVMRVDTSLHVSRTYICCVGPTPITKFVAVEAKATKRPSCEIAGWTLAPLAGVTPSGVEMRVVAIAQPAAAVTHVDVSKTSCAPLGLGAVAPRFVAVDSNETNRPVFAIAGCELAPLAGVTPSGEETRNVVGMHVGFCVNGVTPAQMVRI
jgi:hypothetical protein